MGIFFKVDLSSNVSDYLKNSTGRAGRRSKQKNPTCSSLCLHSSAAGVHQFREAAQITESFEIKGNPLKIK